MIESEKKGRMQARVFIGERVKLRPMVREDLIYLQKWSDDVELRALTGEVSSMSKADCERFFEQVCAEDRREWFAVVTKIGNRVIGEAGLLRMDPVWRTTDVSVIIGEKEEWRKGYGREAILLLLNYAFRHLLFHRVAIGVISFNETALHFWEKLGFRREGVQRDGYYYDGKYHDFVMMSILEDEFRELHGGKSS